MKIVYILAGLLFFCQNIMCAQFSKETTKTLDSVENDLFKNYVKITNYGGSSNPRWSEDSVAFADSVFKSKLLFYTNKFPETIKWNFDSLTQYFYYPLQIVTSSDNLFRIYSWDDMQGGTMRFNLNVFQFKVDGKVKSCMMRNTDTTSDIHSITDEFTKIYTLKTKSKVYYLAQVYDRESSRYRFEGFYIFSIENGMITKAPLIKNDSNLDYIIGFEYDLFAPNANHTIYFKQSNQTIYLPIVEDGTKITKKYEKYRYTGEYFIKVPK